MSGSGGILEYQRELTARLEQVMRERDEWESKTRHMVAHYRGVSDELKEARAEVERLKVACDAWAADMRAAGMLCGQTEDEYPLQAVQRFVAEARTVAERQREACAAVFEHPHSDDLDARSASMVRKAPLATDKEEDADEIGELRRAALSRGQP